MTASITDVARQAGVSVATVSRALRGLPNVAPSTRERVLAAAQELDYVADPHAARLAAGRSQTIGMVVPLVSEWFFSQVVSGAEGVFAAAGYDVLLYSVAGMPAQERFVAELPFRKRVDGLVIVDLPLTDEQLAALCATGLPVTTVGLHTNRCASVTIDNVTAAATATRHLLELGHEHIALLAGLREDPMRFTTPLERRQGYQKALHAAGVAVRPELDVPGNFSLAGGAEGMGRLLALAEPPTAVFAESDEMAIGALKAIGDHGLAAPTDISVVGFDDHDMAEFIGLTTMAQPVVAQGEAAASLLLDQLTGNAAEEPVRLEMPTTLKARATTGPCPTAGRRVATPA